jgi:hypothetical protein
MAKQVSIKYNVAPYQLIYISIKLSPGKLSYFNNISLLLHFAESIFLLELKG